MNRDTEGRRSMTESQLNEVVALYNATQLGFSLLWSRHYLRYGYWDAQTRSLRDALANVDAVVARALDLSSADTLLDAGCGVGGTAINLAQTHRCRVVGLNICQKQLKIARHNARKAKVDEQVTFEEQDFCNSELGDGTFTKALAIESMYHVDSLSRFGAEMSRLLSSGGRLAVVDRFLLPHTTTRTTRKLYHVFKTGQAVGEIATVDECSQIFASHGLRTVGFTDQLDLIEKGISRTHAICLTTYAASLVLSTIRCVPRQLHQQTRALMAIRKLFKRRVVTYGMLVVEKS